MGAKQDAVTIFKAAIAAVQPSQLLPGHIILNNTHLIICGHPVNRASFKKIFVIGAGKAAAAMAAETEKLLEPLSFEGLVITKYHHAFPTKKIRVHEAAHPVPDQQSVNAVNQTLSLLKKVTPEDLVICLLSGGASSLWCDLPDGISLAQFQDLADGLIKSGAAIQDINVVRKHISRIKGGQLLKYCNGAKVFCLIISDVPDDDLSVIGSGPVTGDPSSFREAKNILVRHRLYEQLDKNIREHIGKGILGQIPDTPAPGDPLFDNSFSIIIGSNRIALQAARNKAALLGYTTRVHPTMICGDTVQEAEKMAATAWSVGEMGPSCLLQGGETTLQVTGTGKGGRNQHFVLSALKKFQSLPNRSVHRNFTFLSGGTDGTDGPTDAAGAVANATDLKDDDHWKQEAGEYLNNFDAYHYFNKTDGLIITGPTQTNVMDIMITLINVDEG